MLHRESHAALRSGYRSGALSPVEVVQSALRHAEQVDAQLNAFAWLDREWALARAAESERRWQAGSSLGPLDGMPVTVKEFAAVQGWPTRRGSLVTSAQPAARSGVFVERLLRAGAVLIGKTRAPEFNWKAVTDSPGFGITRNPLDPRLTPGGSSGGCAAAVAAGVVRASVGSDAGGSVRIPAAFTGTIALKPTFGRVPLVPPPSPYFEVVHAGPIAASVAELAEVLRVIAGPDCGDGASVGLREPAFDTVPRAEALRVGLLAPARWADSEPVVKRGMHEVVELLAQAGFDVATLDFDVRRATRVGAFFYELGCLAAVETVPAADLGKLDPALLRFVDPARKATLDDLRRNHLLRDQIGAELHALFDRVDVMLLPTLPIVAFESGRDTPAGWPDDNWMSWNPYTPAFNLTHVPALSFPIWPRGSRLPMGLQCVAAKGREDILLSFAAWLEQRRPARLAGSR